MSHLSRPAFLALSALVACSALSTPSAATAGTVDVTFFEADRFSDAGRGSFDVERTTKALAEVFQAYAKRLPQNQSLKVEVTDVDLAGELRWSSRAAAEVRVLKGRADWPRMDLRYTLSENGQVVKRGEARLSDMTYLQHSLTGRYREAFGYEQRMIDQWFAETFAPGATASR